MKRLFATLLLMFALVPVASADWWEDEDDDYEEDEYEHDCEYEDEDWDDWFDWEEDEEFSTFEEERAFLIDELREEIHYEVEDPELKASLEAKIPAMQNMGEDEFFDSIDAVYDELDNYYYEQGWFDEDYEDFEEEDEDYTPAYDEQALVELITQVIMELKAQGLI